MEKITQDLANFEIDLNLIVCELFSSVKKAKNYGNILIIYGFHIEPARRNSSHVWAQRVEEWKPAREVNAQTKDDWIFMHKIKRRARENEF